MHSNSWSPHLARGLGTTHRPRSRVRFPRSSKLAPLARGSEASCLSGRSPPEARVEIALVDVRLQQLVLASQELMTRDKVTLRLTLTVEYVIAEPARATNGVAQLRDTLYLLAQMASRAYVAAVTLDELLAGRDAMTRALEEDVVPKATPLGVKVEPQGARPLKEIAGSIKEVRVVVGADGMKTLLPAGLLGD